MRKQDQVEFFAPHYVTPAIIGAAVAAASAAEQAREQAAARRKAANQAQMAKQGSGMAAGGASGSVADSLLGQVNEGNASRIKDLIQAPSKQVAGATDAGLNTPPPTPQSTTPIPQGAGSFGQMQQQSPGIQQSMGGQVPDYFQWLQQQGMMGGGMG